MRPILLVMWTVFQSFILPHNNKNNNNNNNNNYSNNNSKYLDSFRVYQHPVAILLYFLTSA